MTITINGNGTVTGISVGGLPDGIVDTDMLADGAATGAKQGAGSIIQVVQNTTSSTQNYASEDFQNTVVSCAITPLCNNSKFLIEAMIQFGLGGDDCAVSCNFSDSLHASGTTHPIAPMTGDGGNGAAGSRMDAFFGFGSFAATSTVDDYYIGNATGRYLYTPASNNANARTFTTMIRSAEGINVRLNMNAHYNQSNPRDMRPESSMTIYEVKV